MITLIADPIAPDGLDILALLHSPVRGAGAGDVSIQHLTSLPLYARIRPILARDNDSMGIFMRPTPSSQRPQPYPFQGSG